MALGVVSSAYSCSPACWVRRFGPQRKSAVPPVKPTPRWVLLTPASQGDELGVLIPPAEVRRPPITPGDSRVARQNPDKPRKTQADRCRSIVVHVLVAGNPRGFRESRITHWAAREQLCRHLGTVSYVSAAARVLLLVLRAPAPIGRGQVLLQLRSGGFVVAEFHGVDTLAGSQGLEPLPIVLELGQRHLYRDHSLIVR